MLCSLSLLTPPWASLPDSLDTLSTLAAQLQTLVAAVIQHPIWAVTAVVLSIVLLQIIVDLIKRAIKAGLTFVLKLPLSMSQWLWKRATTTPPTETEARVAQLMARLESLRQEQGQITAEINALLSLPQIAEKASGSSLTAVGESKE
ncbi:MAG: hypothetical protein WBB01_22670 [Phormidesmis sp.]